MGTLQQLHHSIEVPGAHQRDGVACDLQQPEQDQEYEQPVRALMPGWLPLTEHQYPDAEDHRCCVEAILCPSVPPVVARGICPPCAQTCTWDHFQEALSATELLKDSETGFLRPCVSSYDL